MRSANPALNNNTFRNTRRVSGEQAMSIDGTVNKTALSLLLVMTSAIYTWNNPELGLALFWPVTIFTFILLMITIFNKKSAPITVPLYCLAEGLILGGISAYANALYPGIANQAIALTFGILAALLFLYKSRLIAATENFKLGVFSATFGILIVYVLNLIFSFFRVSFALSISPTGILALSNREITSFVVLFLHQSAIFLLMNSPFFPLSKSSLNLSSLINSGSSIRLHHLSNSG